MKCMALTVLIPMLSTSECAAAQAHLLSVGQGNLCVIRYRNQAMVVDGGSSELLYSALYHRKADKNPVIFRKKDTIQGMPDATHSQPLLSTSPSAILSATDFTDDSPESSLSTATPSPDHDGSPDAKRQRTEYRKNKIKLEYKSALTASCRGLFPKDENDCPTVRTVIISHGDEDHYNLVPEVFDVRIPFKIGTAVLGGLAQDYNKDFHLWLQSAGARIGAVVFTGRADGGQSQELGIWPKSGFARPYHSLLTGRTPTEERIEAALRFETEDGDGTDVPGIEILSMNAVHSMESVMEPDGKAINVVRRANRDSNCGSIVLRVATPADSLLLSGDADEATWEHIMTARFSSDPARRKRLLEGLRSNYLLISHHGSRADGATRMDMLDVIMPKACIVSVGRHRKYHHPHEDTVRLLLQAPTLAVTDSHYVSYFKASPQAGASLSHCRTFSEKMIFSTVNQGDIAIKLDGTFIVRTAREKQNVYQAQNDDAKYAVSREGFWSADNAEEFEKTLECLMAECARANLSVAMWEPVSHRVKEKVIRLKRLPSPNTGAAELLDFLVKADKHRVYRIERLEDERGAITAVSSTMTSSVSSPRDRLP